MNATETLRARIADRSRPLKVWPKDYRAETPNPPAIPWSQFTPDNPEIVARRLKCSTVGPNGTACPRNKRLTELTIACDCRPCGARPLMTWECPDGHFHALIDVKKKTSTP